MGLTSLFGQAAQKVLVDYLEGEADDFVLFIETAVTQRGMPKDVDELIWLARRAFDFVIQHGKPTPDKVAKWLEKDGGYAGSEA